MDIALSKELIQREESAPHNGIHFLCEPDAFSRFQELYLKVRSKENRVYSDEVLRQLPYVTKEITIHADEWRKRVHSFVRLSNYLLSKELPLSILDLGCGNGWMGARLAAHEHVHVSAMDINMTELKQGERVFHHSRLTFYYGNIFENDFPKPSFDFIVMNASVQYFENLSALIERLLIFLKKDGEIHILDSPFYSGKELSLARQRSDHYYQSIGVPEMAAFYHHHDLAELTQNYNCKILSRQDFFHKAIAFTGREMPVNFPWLKITKEKHNSLVKE